MEPAAARPRTTNYDPHAFLHYAKTLTKGTRNWKLGVVVGAAILSTITVLTAWYIYDHGGMNAHNSGYVGIVSLLWAAAFFSYVAGESAFNQPLPDGVLEQMARAEQETRRSSVF